jgi:hypothetical protein
MQPNEQPILASCAILSGDGLTDAVVAAMLARLRSVRVLMETQPGGIDPSSPQAATHARLLTMEAQLATRREPARGRSLDDDEVFYLD